MSVMNAIVSAKIIFHTRGPDTECVFIYGWKRLERTGIHINVPKRQQYFGIRVHIHESVHIQRPG